MHPIDGRPTVRDAGRAEVLARFARLLPSGRPMPCAPTRAERAARPSPTRPGAGRKVVYPDRVRAEAAARALEVLGADPMRAYLCGRSRHGHFHLTTDGVAVRRLARPA